MTEIRNLYFSYGKKNIINDLSFRVEPGQCLVLAGPNGSGKSTLLSLVAGVLRPDSGSIRREGSLGFVPQGSALFEDMSAGDNLRFFARAAGCAVPAQLPFGLESRLGMKVSKMSGGMKKQLSIACALLGDPAVLLMDEPCAALDMEYRQELIQLVTQWKERGTSILYAGHEPMEYACFYDHILFLGDTPRCFSRAELSGEPADHNLLYENVSRCLKHMEPGETTSDINR